LALAGKIAFVKAKAMTASNANNDRIMVLSMTLSSTET
jgi:hypothetical protein